MEPQAPWVGHSALGKVADTQNIIYLTFNVPNIQGEPNLDITEDQISFSATSGK